MNHGRFQNVNQQELEVVNGGWVQAAIPVAKKVVEAVIVVGGVAAGIDAIGQAADSFSKGFSDGYNTNKSNH